MHRTAQLAGLEIGLEHTRVVTRLGMDPAVARVEPLKILVNELRQFLCSSVWPMIHVVIHVVSGGLAIVSGFVIRPY